MSFFQFISTLPLCMYLLLIIVLFTPLNTKKQVSANADGSLTTASAQEVDWLVIPSHGSISINWIDHKNSVIKGLGWKLNWD